MIQSEPFACVLETISHCFAKVPQDIWDADVTYASWKEFLNGCRAALTPVHNRSCVLENWLSAPEVRALKNPPSYSDKHDFAAHHFVGGLPESAMPIESLYRRWGRDLDALSPAAPMNTSAPGSAHSANPTAPAQKDMCDTDVANPAGSIPKGMYDGDSAAYMKSLIERMGMSIPDEFAAYPDHLSLECDLAAVILRSGGIEQGHMFVCERFLWLTDYRLKLLQLDDAQTYFYLALVDILSAIALKWQSERARKQ